MASGDTSTIIEDSAGVFRDRRRAAYVGALSADASPTVTVADSLVRRYTTALTAARSITLSNTNAYLGATMRIIRADTAAFTLDVKKNDGSTLKQIPSATAAFIDVIHDGTDWLLTAYGAL